MAKKYYAVRKGKTTGIFLTWADCQAQTSGFSGAEFKSFTNIEEAEKFLEASITKNNSEATASVEKPDDIADGPVAYVDGSYDKISGDFSYGMILLHEGKEWKDCRRIKDEELAQMHNVAGEIKGAQAAMNYAITHGFDKITIYHDYEGIAKWCTGEWKTNKEGTKAYKAYYESICQKLQVNFVKVKGHSNDKYNDIADELAKQALGLGTVIHELDSI